MLDEFDANDVAMDFAGEFEKSQKSKPKRTRENEDSEEDMSDDEEFDYNEMQFSDDDLDALEGEEEKYTEKDYEKALLENMSPDEFSDEDDDLSTPKKKMKLGSSEAVSMFADAEKFADLLEGSGEFALGGSEDVDMRGVNWKQQQWEMNRMRNLSRGGKNRERGSRNFRQGSAVPGKSSQKFGHGSTGPGKTSKNFNKGRKIFGKGRGKPEHVSNKQKKSKRSAKTK